MYKINKKLMIVLILIVVTIFIILGFTGIWNTIELKEGVCEVSYKQYYIGPYISYNFRCLGQTPPCGDLNPSLKVTADLEFLTCLCKNNDKGKVIDFFNSDIKNELRHFLVYDSDKGRYTFSGELISKPQLVEKISHDFSSICTLRRRGVE